MRLNSVLKACSLFCGSEEGHDRFAELVPAHEGPWESWLEAPPGKEKSSEVVATGLSRVEGRDRSGN